MSKRTIPAFENESDEARWWFEHRAEIADDLIAASRNGNPGEGSMARHTRKLHERAEEVRDARPSSESAIVAKRA